MQHPRKYSQAFQAITQLLSEREMGFNELLRALQRKGVVNSSSTLAHYLRILTVQGRIERRVIREDRPRILEYRLSKKAAKPQPEVFKKLGDVVKTSDSVIVTLTDLKTGEKRTLTPDKKGKWVDV